MLKSGAQFGIFILEKRKREEDCSLTLIIIDVNIDWNELELLKENDQSEEKLVSMNPIRREVYEQNILRCLLAKAFIKDIGPAVGLDQSTVRKYIKAPEFREMLRQKYPDVYARVDADLQEQADTISHILEENSRKALDRIAALIESANEHIALKASVDALDRFEETAAVQKGQIDHTVKLDPVFLIHAAATAEEVDRFKPKPKELPAASASTSLPEPIPLTPKKETVQ